MTGMGLVVNATNTLSINVHKVQKYDENFQMYAGTDLCCTSLRITPSLLPAVK